MDKTQRKQMIMKDMSEKMKWLKVNHDYNILGMFLQGSQNYEMDIYSDEYMSDVDVKVLVLPSLESVLKGSKMVSKVYVMDDNSHVEVKDIRLMLDLWVKSNPAYLELLFTEFRIIENSRIMKIIGIAEDIAAMNKDRLLSCCKGMAYEKRKALCHPYPTIKDKIDLYGYDPKQLHHLVRMSMMIREIFLKGSNFSKALVFDDENKSILMDFKTNIYSLDDAIRIADETLSYIDQTVECVRMNYVFNFDSVIYRKLQDIIYDTIKQAVNEEVLYSLKSGQLLDIKRIKVPYEKMDDNVRELLNKDYSIHEGQMVEYDLSQYVTMFNFWER